MVSINLEQDLEVLPGFAGLKVIPGSDYWPNGQWEIRFKSNFFVQKVQIIRYFADKSDKIKIATPTAI